MFELKCGGVCTYSVHDSDDEKTDLGIGAVERVCCDADGHTARCRAAICESHKPRLESARLPLDIGDAHAERKAFKCLMEDDGNE